LVGRNPLGSGAGVGKGPALAFFSREVEMTRALLVAMLLFGGPTVAVPKVVGLSYEQAKTRINERGLQVGNVEPGHCTRPVGAVCRQNPQAGRKVDITEPVHLIVSRGPKR
jgi:beta-lactam-binding protein with PASTA domain